MSDNIREALHHQGYNFISEESSSAIKPCMWCKRAIRGGQSCYKHQFYGIPSEKCVQMTPTLRCNQRCIFCWRSVEHELGDKRELSPDEIISAIPKLQRKGLSGDKPFSDEKKWKEATSYPTQFAVSLSGEPTLYSQLPELIEKLKNPDHSVFVVSNGTVPSMIKRIAPTQLYISLDATSVEEYEKVCRPLGSPDIMWANILESLSLLKDKEKEGIRTAVRITLVKNLNNFHPEKYASLIREAAPLYVEIKGYMYLGYSRIRLSETAIPDMEEVRSFAADVARYSDYEVMDENIPSRVVCLRRKR